MDGLHDVYVRARNVKNPSELASAINTLLGVDYDKAYQKVTNKSFSEILIKMQVEETKAKELTKYAGVYLSQNVARVYPYNKRVVSFKLLKSNGTSTRFFTVSLDGSQKRLFSSTDKLRNL